MLVDISNKSNGGTRDLILRMISSMGGREVGPTRIDTGMYLVGHWNFGYQIAEPHEEYPELTKISDTLAKGEPWLSCYGVCDSPEQWREHYAKIVEDPNKRYCVSFVRLDKNQEPEDGGWRWHKWGQYIGKQEPQCEYLAHEPVIETVYTFHVYEIL